MRQGGAGKVGKEPKSSGKRGMGNRAAGTCPPPVRQGISTQVAPFLELSTALTTNWMPRRPSATVG